jgi:hypothetical protein
MHYKFFGKKWIEQHFWGIFLQTHLVALLRTYIWKQAFSVAF